MKKFLGFSLRLILVHTITYLIFGLVFMYLSSYFDYFSQDEILSQVMRSSEDSRVRMAILFQLLRGFLMAAALYPFRSVFLGGRWNFLKLFVLIFLLTSYCAVVPGPGSIEGFIYTKFKFEPFIGLPEITLQMLAFSWIFCIWERSRSKRQEVWVN